MRNRGLFLLVVGLAVALIAGVIAVASAPGDGESPLQIALGGVMGLMIGGLVGAARWILCH